MGRRNYHPFPVITMGTIPFDYYVSNRTMIYSPFTPSLTCFGSLQKKGQFRPNFQQSMIFGPNPDHVVGTNDHVFGSNLRQSIILRPDTVNQSYCIVYFSPSWDQVTYPRGTNRYWSWVQFGPIIWFDQRRWVHLPRKLGSSLYESQSESLTLRDQSDCKDFWNWNN